MVRIRLRRVGAKKQPSYRVVVADQRNPRDGRFLETIGHYNPRTEPETVKVDGPRAQFWLSRGAQPSDAVARLLNKFGITATSAGTAQTDQDAEAEAAAKAPVAEPVAEPVVEAEAIEEPAPTTDAE